MVQKLDAEAFKRGLHSLDRLKATLECLWPLRFHISDSPDTHAGGLRKRYLFHACKRSCSLELVSRRQHRAFHIQLSRYHNHYGLDRNQRRIDMITIVLTMEASPMHIEERRRSILREAWRLARLAAAASGRPAREHLAEGQRAAWDAARAEAGPIGAAEAVVDLVMAQGVERDAADARGRYTHRQLGEALEYGFALLDALDLGPMALDVVDDAIATLDALDAPHEDLEPWLNGIGHLFGYALDAEDDSEEAESTALERHGRGFVRAGEDDAEEDDPAERDDHHGSEDDPHPWRFERADAVRHAALVCEVARHD